MAKIEIKLEFGKQYRVKYFGSWVFGTFMKDEVGIKIFRTKEDDILPDLIDGIEFR